MAGLTVDSLPVEVHVHQPKVEWNGYCQTRTYHPLIISIGETSNMLEACLRSDNVSTAEGPPDMVLV